VATNSFPLPRSASHTFLHEHSEYARCTGLDLLLSHAHRLTIPLRASCNAQALASSIARRNDAEMTGRARTILDR
jgi:hypothetical protein